MNKHIIPLAAATALLTAGAAFAGVAVGKSSQSSEAAPASCIEAIREAQILLSHAGEFANISARWPDISTAALEAGLSGSPAAIDRVAQDIGILADEIEDINDEIDIYSFRNASAECESAG